MSVIRIGMAAMAAALLTTSAHAENAAYDFTKPADFVRALQKAGYRAELKKRDNGEPYVASAANGNDFTLYFYECDALKLVCKSFEFYSWWKKEPYFTLALVNKWNAGKRFMKVAIDDQGDLEERVYGTGVGMTQPNFVELLDWYTSMDSAMSKFLDAEKPAEPKK